MDDNAKRLIEARRLITKLARSCRQTLTYLDGISALDEHRLK